MEPKYGNAIETLDEFLNSDVVYGYYPILHFAASTLSYPKIVTFFESKERKEDCSDLRKCVERMTTKRDIAIFSDPVLVIYVATKNVL